jgi:hypothetical protein
MPDWKDLAKKTGGGYFSFKTGNTQEAIFDEYLGEVEVSNNFNGMATKTLVQRFRLLDPVTGVEMFWDVTSKRAIAAMLALQPARGVLIRVDRSGTGLQTQYKIEAVGKSDLAVAQEVFTDPPQEEQEGAPF